MDDDLDRTPMPPDPQPGDIKPMPTPLRWGVTKVGHVNDGEPLLLLKFWLITGQVDLFLPASAAQRLADQLFTNASGLHLAGPGTVVP